MKLKLLNQVSSAKENRKLHPSNNRSSRGNYFNLFFNSGQDYYWMKTNIKKHSTQP
jgi:hypothetical protein